MPEIGHWLFRRCRSECDFGQGAPQPALLFLMSGVSVGASDAVALGLADAVVAADRVEAIRADLVGAAGSSHPQTAIVRRIEAVTVFSGDAPFCALADQLPSTPPSRRPSSSRPSRPCRR